MTLRPRSLLVPLLLATAAPALAAPAAVVLAGTVRKAGLLPVAIDARGGRVILSLPAPQADGVSARFLHVASLKTGLGSAPIGLDRALSGPSRIVAFRRIGKKVALEVENPRFRATDAPSPEQAAARDSIVYSTLWMGDVAGEEAGGRILVDIAPLLTRDVVGIADALKAAGEKGFAQVADLSVADAAATKVFPDNIEFEARQTFASAEPSAEIRNIAPAPGNLGFVVRQSLIRLPDIAGYRPRRFDPRAGGFASQAVDYAAPLGQPVVYDLANRFRLEKLDPSAAKSRVKKPILFHVDRSAPEPIRSALMDGVGWWKDAFEAAGYIDAFQVALLPEGADPLDVRYNVVNWVNRATRGWSYGQVVEDPRTGEIVKGGVLLGSLRVRQDMLIFEGLVGADKVGKGGPNDPVQVSLARLRQLAAHEVGHALGLVHNFAASTQDRASVMDYPAPRIGIVDGAPDLSDAYGTGLGKWDRFAVDWLYGDDQRAHAKADAMVSDGLRFADDGDARAISAAQPWGSMWDDGGEAPVELERILSVRRAALARFGTVALHPGEPVANLRRKFVPIWLLHRYQVEAAAKWIGGVDFAYSVAGDGRELARPVDPAAQRRAIASLLVTLAPSQLEVPDGLVPLLSAGNTANYDRQYAIEIMGTAGNSVFDPLVAAEVAAQQTLNALLAPDRLDRLADQARRNPQSPGPEELLSALIGAVTAPATEAGLQPIRRRIVTTTALALARVRRDPMLGSALALMIDERLAQLAQSLARPDGDPADRDWSRGLARLLADREALDAAATDLARAPTIPPGMPIGAMETDWMDDVL